MANIFNDSQIAKSIANTYRVNDLTELEKGWETVTDPDAIKLFNDSKPDSLPGKFRQVSSNGQSWLYNYDNGLLQRRPLHSQMVSGKEIFSWNPQSTNPIDTPTNTDPVKPGDYSVVPGTTTPPPPEGATTSSRYGWEYPGYKPALKTSKAFNGFGDLNLNSVFDAVRGANALNLARKSAKAYLDVPTYLENPLPESRKLLDNRRALELRDQQMGQLYHQSQKAIGSDLNSYIGGGIKGATDANVVSYNYLKESDAARKASEDLAYNAQRSTAVSQSNTANKNAYSEYQSAGNAAAVKSQLWQAEANVKDTLLSGLHHDYQTAQAERKAYQDKYDMLTMRDKGINLYAKDHPEIADYLLMARYDPARYQDQVTKGLISTDTQREVLTGLRLATQQGQVDFFKSRGVRTLADPTTQNPGPFKFYAKGGNIEGTVYKAQLDKRTKDAERLIKSIADKNGLVVKLISKQVDQMEKLLPPTPIKHAFGGTVATLPFNLVRVPQAPVAPLGTGAEESSKKDGLGNKELIDLLKQIDGLPSDTKALKGLLNNIVSGGTDAADPLGLLSSGNIETNLVDFMAKAKQAKFYKEHYDKAVENLESNQGLSEAAIDSYGNVIMKDTEGRVQKVAASDLQNAYAAGYQNVTNSQLLTQRSEDINSSFNGDLIAVAENGIGMKFIDDKIKDLISQVKSDSEEFQTYTKITGDKDAIKGGLALLPKLQQSISSSGSLQDTIQGLYKSGQLTESNVDQLSAALTYLQESLPQNAQTLLLTKTKGDQAKALQLIAERFNSATQKKSRFTVDREKDEDADKTKSSSTSKDPLSMGPAELLQYGKGKSTKIHMQTPGMGTLSFDIEGVELPIVSTSGQPLGDTNTLLDVSKSAMRGALDMKHATIGDVNIPLESLDQVLTNGSIVAGYLPVAANSDGTLRPAITEIEQVNSILIEAAKKYAVDSKEYAQEVNDALNEAGLDDMFINGDVNQLNKAKYCKFAMLDGTALSTAVPETVAFSDYVKDVEDENVINNTYAALNRTRGKEEKLEYNDGWFSRDHVYQGVIFIPIIDNPFSLKVGEGVTSISREDVNTIQGKADAVDRQKKYRSQGNLTL